MLFVIGLQSDTYNKRHHLRDFQKMLHVTVGKNKAVFWSDTAMVKVGLGLRTKQLG